MEIGDINKKFGWVWLFLFMVFGLFLEIKLGDPKWASQPFAMPRDAFRAAHVHANLLAVLNLLYGVYIAEAALSDSMKKLGSYSILAGAIIQPIGIIAIGFALPPFLSMIGGILAIIGVGVIAYGYITK